MYCTPEVEYELPKNSKSDVFSLGFVFMEIITILCRRRLQDFAEYRGDDGDQAYHFHLDKCITWMKDLRDAIQNDSNKRQEVEAWKRSFDLCNMMTKPDKDDRCSSANAFLFWQKPTTTTSSESSEIHSKHNATQSIDQVCMCLNMWEKLYEP
jgi:hypothetical protein